MNTNAYLPLYDYLNTISESTDPDVISAVSYSNLLDDVSMALIDYRLEHHLNQTQLAEFLSCSQSLVSAYESCARNISAEKLCDLMSKIGKKVRLSFEDVSSDSVGLSDSSPVFPDSDLNNQTSFAFAS